MVSKTPKTVWIKLIKENWVLKVSKVLLRLKQLCTLSVTQKHNLYLHFTIKVTSWTSAQIRSVLKLKRRKLMNFSNSDLWIGRGNFWAQSEFFVYSGLETRRLRYFGCLNGQLNPTALFEVTHNLWLFERNKYC